MRVPKIITLLSIIIFVASLTQSCYNTEGHDPRVSSPGFYLLLLGPIGLFAGVFEWLANPVLLWAWVFSFAGKNKIALPLGILASALMLAFRFRHSIIVNEAGHYGKIVEYSAGYWLWLTSGAFMIVSGTTGVLTQRHRD